MNISSDTIREKLLQESGLKLERAVDMCRSMEATFSYLKYMAASAIPTKGGESAAAETEKAFAIPTMEWDTVAAQATTATIKPKKKCQYCGQVHKPRACPAWGRQCSYCGKMNHARTRRVPQGREGQTRRLEDYSYGRQEGGRKCNVWWPR